VIIVVAGMYPAARYGSRVLNDVVVLEASNDTDVVKKINDVFKHLY